MTRPTIVTVTGPASEPVTVQEARTQCSLYDSTTHDTLLAQLISAARASVEQLAGVRCMTQTVRLELDGFPDAEIDLGCYPVASITSVKYDDTSGVEQTLVSGTDYWPSLGGMFPRLVSVDGWPTAYEGKPASVRVVMVVGNASAASLSPDVKQAILLRITELFEHRSESIEAVSIDETPVSMRLLLAPHTRMVT